MLWEGWRCGLAFCIQALYPSPVSSSTLDIDQASSNGLTYVLGELHLTEQGDELVIYLWGTNANHNGVRDACTCTYTCTQRPI
jgi:hypothetical protein